ncbi:MAG TPA: hypothetical protein VIH24_09310 [Candidatus Limnocylindria bacterium]
MARHAPSPQLGAGLTSILDMPERLAALVGLSGARAERMMNARTVMARGEPPPQLEPWLTEVFGSVEVVREQTIVRVDNLATGDATLFAPLRARRPVDGPGHATSLSSEIAATEGDPFCDPESGTPAHPFGRVWGRRMVTGANAAAAGEYHAVLVFDRHDPLAFDADLVADLFDTGRAWADRARTTDPAAGTYLLIWNCLWRAGGSIVHGHAQALLGSGPHHARVERFRRDAGAYRATHGADLATDLVGLHADLGLARGTDVAIVANLTPVKERELLVIGRPGMDERDTAFSDAVARALLALRDRMGVSSFNLALWRPPLDPADGWEGIPPIVRIVDRGDPFQRPSDIGAMELYGTPIVGSDPYEVIAALD